MELKELRKNLEAVGAETVAETTRLLLAGGKVATGTLINSIRYEVLQTVDGLLLNILAADYFKNVDEGRRPGRMPPTRAIIPWVQARGIQFSNKRGGFLPIKSTAFLIARSIGMKGITPMNIKQQVVNNILMRKAEFLAKGLKIDIEKYMKENIFDKQIKITV